MKSVLSLIVFSLSLVSVSAFASSDSPWKFGVGVGYSPNFLLNMTATSSSGTKKEYDMEYSGATGVSVHAWYVPRNAWAFISGYEYSGERELQKAKIDGVNSTITSPSKYQMNSLYVGTAYRWDSFYLPLALNFGFVEYTPPAGSTGTSEAKGGVGAMFGLGWFIGDSFVIEYIGRSTTTELKTTSGSTTVNGTGTIGSAMLTLKYMY